MMAPERVHPRDDTESPLVSGEHKPSSKPQPSAPYSTSSSNGDAETLTRHPSQDSLMSNSGPPFGTYIIQLPKDQIFRVPPPENAYKFQRYTKQAKRRRGSCCCRCLCFTIGILLLLAAILAITSGVLYLIYKPKASRFSIEKASVNGIKLSTTASTAAINPVFNFTVKSTNPNSKIGIYYLESGSSVEVFHQEDRLGDGTMPEFYAPARDVRNVYLLLKGGEIVPSRSARSSMLKEQQAGRVPVRVVADVPVRFKIGKVKTWKMTAKVKCTVVLSTLSTNAKVVEKDCRFKVRPW